MPIRSGELDYRIRIERRTDLRDEAGEPLNSWDFFAERWASIQSTPGREVFASAERGGIVPTVFRLRYLAGVLPAMRIVLGSRIFDVKSVLRQRRLSGEMLITAEEIVDR